VAGTQLWQGWAGGSQGRPPRPRLLVGVLMAVSLMVLFIWSWRGLAGVMILAGVALAALVVLWAVPRVLVPPIPDEELPPRSEPKDRLDAVDARLGRRNDLRNGLLQTLVVAGVLAGAWLGFQQLTDARDKAADDRNKAIADRDLTRQGQASERFTRAISQLGDKRVETRIGGIYGLALVAEQSIENNSPVGEVVLAYINRLPRRKIPATRLSERVRSHRRAIRVPHRRDNPGTQRTTTVSDMSSMTSSPNALPA
jgi:hypothetical protein